MLLDGDLDLELVQQSAPLHVAPVDLGHPLLPPAAHHLRHGQQDDLFLFERRDDFVQPVGLDDGDDVFHFASLPGLSDHGVRGFAVLGQVQPDALVVLAHPQADNLSTSLSRPKERTKE